MEIGQLLRDSALTRTPGVPILSRAHVCTPDQESWGCKKYTLVTEDEYYLDFRRVSQELHRPDFSARTADAGLRASTPRARRAFRPSFRPDDLPRRFGLSVLATFRRVGSGDAWFRETEKALLGDSWAVLWVRRWTGFRAGIIRGIGNGLGPALSVTERTRS
jgi:hypothetical protein